MAPKKEPSETSAILERLKALDAKMDLILSNQAAAYHDFEQVLEFLDRLNRAQENLGDIGLKVYDFYKKLKNQEQEIFWNHIKNPS
jgi:hypothetical protein